MTVSLETTKKSPSSSTSATDRSAAIRLVNAVMRVAIEQKALDVRGLDLEGISDIADCFVILSGTSQRHVKGISDKVLEALRESGEKPIATSGQKDADWILLDYGNLIVHLFYEPTRQYYKMDELWKKAKELPLPEDLEEQARKLRTGLYLNISEI